MLDKSKQLLFEKQAEIAKAIAHPLRIAIVNFLVDGEQCVCDIAEYVTLPSTSAPNARTCPGIFQ